MLVCERLGCPEGAARFAQAAVRQVDVAYPADRNAVADTSTSARAVREGRLWSNLFVYSLDAGRYEVRISQHPSHFSLFVTSPKDVKRGRREETRATVRRHDCKFGML